MKAEIKARPQSKKIASNRPISRHVNTEQAQTAFKQGKDDMSNKKFQKAIECYIKATMYDPNFYQAYCNMGTCYRSLNRFN